MSLHHRERIKKKVKDAQAAAEKSSDDLAKLKAELDEKDAVIQEFRRKEASDTLIGLVGVH